MKKNFLGIEYLIERDDEISWVTINQGLRLSYGILHEESLITRIKSEIVERGHHSTSDRNDRYNIYPKWTKAGVGCGHDYYLHELPYIFSITKNEFVKGKWNFQAYKIENENNKTYTGSCFKVCDSLKEAKQNVFAAYKYLTYSYKEKTN